MIIDVNVHFGYWAFRKLSMGTLREIEKKLKENKISKCFISHLGPVLNFQEVDAFNEELEKKIKNNIFFIFVPIVNPILLNSVEYLEKYKFIKIVPSYHNYSLIDKRFEIFFKNVSDKNIIVFLQMRYEDERSHNPVFKVKSPSIEEIKEFAYNYPEMKMVLLCPYFSEIIHLCKIDNVYSDISFAEHFKTIKALIKDVSEDKILFGSHTPFLYTESEVAKIEYSEVEMEKLEKIMYKNIMKLTGELE